MSGPPAPLTGLPAASQAAAAGPAVAVVVSGTSPAGLGSADLVLDEMVAPVRYLAVYQSDLPITVGPVSGIEPEDHQALSVLHPLVAYHGAAAKYFVKLLDNSPVTDVGGTAFASIYRTTPQGLMVSPRAAVRREHTTHVPPPLFPYWSAGSETLASTGAWRPTSVQVSAPGVPSQQWSYDAHAKRWVLTRGGPSVQVANLVIQTVSYKEVHVDPHKGLSLASADVIGAGRAEVFSGSAAGGSGGTAATGTWSKPKPGDVTNYYDASRSPMVFEPGPTWVVLVPAGARVTSTPT